MTISAPLIPGALRPVVLFLILTTSVSTALQPGGSPATLTHASATIVGYDHTHTPKVKLVLMETASGAGGAGGAAAWGSYAATYHAIGWDVLNVTTAAELPPLDTMYAAGYLEGSLSQKSIWAAYQNMYPQFFTMGSPPPAKFTAWMGEHMEWVVAKAAAGASSDRPEYWAAVGAILAQLKGISAGYSSAAPAAEAMSYTDMLVMNLDGDLETLMDVIGGMDCDGGCGGRSAGAAMFEDHLGVAPGAGYHCSALVRVSPAGDDIFFGHDTWDTYSSMVRTYKHYNFHLGPKKGRKGGATPVSMSSTPGWLSSVDDFYLTGVRFTAHLTHTYTPSCMLLP